MKWYYPNGNIQMRYEVKDGIPYGKWREYYEDGTLSWEGTFIGDKKIDSSFSYYPNGIIEWRGFYDKDGENVSLRQYDTLGNLILKQERISPIHGYREYYENGKLVEWHDFIIRKKDGKIERITNQEIFFDEHGDTIFGKSHFIRLWINKDTVESGDTIRIRFSFEPGDRFVPNAFLKAEIAEHEISENGEFEVMYKPYVLTSAIGDYKIAYWFSPTERGRKLLQGRVYQVEKKDTAYTMHLPYITFFQEYYVK